MRAKRRKQRARKKAKNLAANLHIEHLDEGAAVGKMIIAGLMESFIEYGKAF